MKSLTLRYRIMLNFATTCAICNSSDLGVRLSSMPVNWKGRVAIRVLGRQSRGDFQFYRCEIHELVDLIPHIARQGLRPCSPFLAFSDQTSSPVVDAHWCDIMPMPSRYH